MRKTTILLLAIAMAGVLKLFIGSVPSSDKANNVFALVPTPYPTISVPENYTVTESDTVASQVSRNIEVLSPISNEKVKSGFVVKGNARTEDNIVVIRLSDSYGNILSETTAVANSPSPGTYGPFEKSIIFNSADSSGKLDVFRLDKNDGTIRDLITIPLNFKQ